MIYTEYACFDDVKFYYVSCQITGYHLKYYWEIQSVKGDTISC